LHEIEAVVEDLRGDKSMGEILMGARHCAVHVLRVD
jgi:hypothetical protein